MGETEKPFSLGILVGRFQTIHAGHELMIETALSLCKQVGIFVGSAQEAGTAQNPFSYETREKLLRLLFGEQVQIFLCRTSAWATMAPGENMCWKT